MAAIRRDHYDDYVFSACKIIIPVRKEFGIRKPRASSNLVRIGERSHNMSAVRREQIRMTQSDMSFALRAKLNSRSKVRATEFRHSTLGAAPREQ
jgi:hypothetical protein